MSDSITWPVPAGDPEELGFSTERLQQVDRFINGMLEKQYTAGAVAVIVRNGKRAYAKCFGHQDREKDIPMAPDSIFRFYSMSKPVTTAAVLSLYEQQEFLLDEPVKRYLPVFEKVKVKVERPDGTFALVPPVRDVTIHDLLTHTGGVSYEGMHEASQEGKTLAEFVAQYDTVPLVHQPGTTWHYGASNDILGHLCEVVSGTPYDVFLKERIFDPLGMTDTAFKVADEKKDRFCQIYTHDENRQLIPMPDEGNYRYENPVLFSGGGGLTGTTIDYLKFLMMLLGNGEFSGTRILGRKTVDLMHTDHLPPGHGPIQPFKFGYGLGVSVLRSLGEKQGIGSVGEYGWGGAASTDVWVDPAENMVTMIMMQLRPNFTQMLTKRVKDAMYQALI